MTSERGGLGQAFSLDDYKRREVTIGGTTFRITKLLPMEAFDTLEILREAIGGRAAGMIAGMTLAQGDSSAAVINRAVGTLIGVLIAVPAAELKEVRNQLFAQVSFTNGTAQTPQPVAGNEGMAFQGLEAVHVYELLLRAFVVNFTESWDAIASLMP